MNMKLVYFSLTTAVCSELQLVSSLYLRSIFSLESLLAYWCT